MLKIGVSVPNFEFYNPTTVSFGPGILEEGLKKHLAQHAPGANLMITYGGQFAKRSGLIERIRGILDQMDESTRPRKIVEFGGIRPNPRYEKLIEGAGIAKKEQTDFILAVGGGSVIDGTKAIAMFQHYDDGDPWQLFADPLAHAPKTATPIATVLTLPASGSEMNMGTVVSNGDLKLGYHNPLLFPKFSVLDPELTYSLPDNQTVNGIVDAAIHVLEYTSSEHCMHLSEMMAHATMKTLLRYGPLVLENRSDPRARSEVMWAATVALNGFISAAGIDGGGLMHQIGHAITALTGADHGQSLASVMRGCLLYEFETKKYKLAKYAENVFGIMTGDVFTKARAAIDLFEKSFEDMGMRCTLSASGIEGPKDFDFILKHVQRSMDRYGRKGLGENGNIGQKEILDILGMCRP